jgi:hypothetical protein
MLLGEPAARKSTSIKMVKRVLSSSGYNKFSADKTSKEKFLLDLEGLTEDESDTEGTKKSKKVYNLQTAENLWGGSDSNEPREVFIIADEFNEFAGPGNLDFFTTLGNLWDFDSPEQPFSQRLKNSKSVSICQPTISILSGNTPELFARAFPPESIGSGFLSRLLLIHGERSGRRITKPPPPDELLGGSLSSYLSRLHSIETHRLEVSGAADSLLDSIYQSELGVPDIRFKAYSNRRFNQLYRISIILATAQFSTEVSYENVLQANTILTHAELQMPKALGEFGKGKNSDIANKIMDYIDTASGIITPKELWIQVSTDLNSQKDMMDIVAGLIQAEKLQTIQTSHGSGFLPKKKIREPPKFIDWQFLSKEEKDQVT